MPIYHSVTELIGRTPLLELCNYERNHDLKAVLLAKLECMNPAGSAKDRVAANMIARAEMEGRLAPGGTIIEPTSGNTGIGLAAAAAAKGYRVILTMPDTMSVERRALIAAYGAEIILTPGAAGMAGAVAKAEELHIQIAGGQHLVDRVLEFGQFVDFALCGLVRCHFNGFGHFFVELVFFAHHVSFRGTPAVRPVCRRRSRLVT